MSYDADGCYTVAEMRLLGVPLDLPPYDAMCDRPLCCRLAGRLLPGVALCETHYDRCSDGVTYTIPGVWLADAPPGRMAEYEARLAEVCEQRRFPRCSRLDRDLEARIAEAVRELDAEWVALA